VPETGFALSPVEFVRSVDASRDTLDKPRMKLIDVVERVRALTGDAPYAIVGGLAQILWARKSHTDDLDVALAAKDIHAAHERIAHNDADSAWTIPGAGAYEADDVFEVYHLLHDGSVVDLIAFRDADFNQEILGSAREVTELSSLRFIRPELLLVTHLLRPGPVGALAAIELAIARRATGGLDLDDARKWAAHVGRSDRLERVLQQADAMALI
jgi:hypothetical protein